MKSLMKLVLFSLIAVLSVPVASAQTTSPTPDPIGYSTSYQMYMQCYYLRTAQYQMVNEAVQIQEELDTLYYLLDLTDRNISTLRSLRDVKIDLGAPQAEIDAIQDQINSEGLIRNNILDLIEARETRQGELFDDILELAEMLQAQGCYN